MNASRIAAMVAATLIGLLSSSQAQDLDTSPSYSPYAATQPPRVGLPAMRTGGYTMDEAAAPSAQARPETRQNPPSWASPQVETGRRTDAGAVRKKDRGTEKAPVTEQTKEAVQAAPAAAGDTIPAGTVLEGLAEVYDGQNLVVSGVAVRLDGAEAPAAKQQCLTRKALVWPCGAKASARLKEFVGGRKVRCTVQSEIGNGVAAVCSGNGISDFASNLVTEGLAVSNGHDKGRYAAAQESARARKAGMWVGSFEAPWSWRLKNGQ